MNLKEAYAIMKDARTEISVNTYRLSRETFAEGYMLGFIRSFERIKFTLSQMEAALEEDDIATIRGKIKGLILKLEHELE